MKNGLGIGQTKDRQQVEVIIRRSPELFFALEKSIRGRALTKCSGMGHRLVYMQPWDVLYGIRERRVVVVGVGESNAGTSQKQSRACSYTGVFQPACPFCG